MKSKNLKKAEPEFHAILALGVSTKKKLFKARVLRAVEWYKNGVASKIIFSGRWWGGLKKKPENTEARLMMQYALSLGVPRKDILLEERSLNTGGNFYFTKKLILRPKKFTRLRVILQESNMEKAKYLAEKVLGGAYNITWENDGTEPGLGDGHVNLESIKKFFSNVKNGDDTAIAEILRKHPHYKKYRSI